MSESQVRSDTSAEDGGYSAAQSLVVVRALFFLVYAGLPFTFIFLPVYYKQIGLSGTQIGTLTAILPIVALFASPVSGVLNDRFGRIKDLIAIAAIGAALGALLLSRASGFFWLILCTILFSLFSPSLNTLLNSVTLKLLGDNREGYGRIRMWATISFVLSNMIFGPILAWTGEIWLFYLYAIFLTLCALTAMFLRAEETTITRPISTGLGELVRQPGWGLFMLGLVVISIGNSGMNAFLGIYVVDLGGETRIAEWLGGTGLVGQIWALTALSEIPVLFYGQPILKRFGAQPLLAMACGLFAVRFILYSIIPSAEWAIPLGLMQGVTFSPWLIAGVAGVDEFAPPDLKATSQGIYFAALSLATAIASQGSGILYDLVGIRVLFQILAMLSLVALALLLWAVQIRRAAQILHPSPE